MHHFQQMPPHAKCWVYASNRVLTTAEQEAINKKAEGFTGGWTAHDQPLKASFDLLHGVFLVIMVDTDYNGISGCGIDKSIHFIREIEQELNVDLFDRMQAEFLVNGEVIIASKAGAAKLFGDGIIHNETICFNKNIITRSDFDTRFMIPFRESWIAKAAGELQSSQ